MPEAVAAAPAVGAPAAPAKPAAPAPAATKPPTPPASPDAKGDAPEKSEVDESTARKEAWKKYAAGKTIKHKGAERPLEDFDPDEAFELIRRGHGASHLVAEANKTKADAEKVLALKKAIADGDDNAALDALYEFGGDRGLKLLDRVRAEMAKQAELEEQLTPREREAHERAQAAERRAKELESEKQAREREEQTKAAQAEEAQTRREALGKVNEVLKLTKGLPKERAEVLLPFVARAWREAIETGQELGRDVPAEAITKRAEQLFRASTSDFYSGLSTAEQFEFLGEAAVRKLSDFLVKRIRGNPVVAKPAAAAEPSRKSEPAPGLGDPRYFLR